ncbi:MAG: SHOCT domain-containing protein [Nitrososphaeraceae archaeon]|nr:SHOCT domain-containing protein [Nitrososphaeraceae archaeon]MDW0178510.1 SHOCT domain-containing protein [Nitrososphaeraceae archaeon]MDW0183331.1 SHOCT domain-containing protein [Nitrososphaeraceae archaeon]MDW0184947.1 SHOCT domain-containing protein [Nitrososphaeraceae archaeon]MDW0194409.1 SHOCT domain-containing protein [Nitrososphaeraceae archaeon]
MDNLIEIMRGRWASAAIGAGVARRQAGAQMDQQEAAHQREMDQLRAEQQREMERLKQDQSKPQQSGQEDVTQKLQKLADLKKQGILSDEEFQKLKMELLAKL